MLTKDPDVIYSDCLLDYSRMLKLRREVAIFKPVTCRKKTREGCQSGNGMIDDDYKLFLTYLVKSNEPNHYKTQDISGDYDADDGDDLDPHYNIFLSKLTKDGRSYILELPENDRASGFLKYESGDMSDDENNGWFQRKRNTSTKGESIRKDEVFTSFRRKGEVGEWRSFGILQGAERKFSARESCSMKMPAVVDSHKSELQDKSATESSQDMSDDESNGWFHRKRNTLTKGESIRKDEAFTSFQRKDEVGEWRSSGILQEAERKFSARQSCPMKMPAVEDSHKSELQGKSATESFMVESCYQIFLNGIEEEGQHIAFVCGDGRRVLYEEDDGMSSDSEILVWDANPYCDQGKNDPFVPAKANASIGGNETSKFRKKVMRILRRPYSEKEYQRLLKDVKLKKSVGRNKDLRGRSISFSVAGLKKSYLDHHQDLKNQVDAVRQERPKVLNLLRGFFYWLKHLANEGDGVFRPWLDASCLAVQPGSQ